MSARGSGEVPAGASVGETGSRGGVILREEFAVAVTPGLTRRERAPAVFKLIAGLLPFYALATAVVAVPDNWALGLFMWAVLVLTFAVMPATRQPADQDGIPWYDWFAISVVTVTVGYYILGYEDLQGSIGAYAGWQHAIMALTLLLTLEAARRAMGIVVPIIGAALIVWALQQDFPTSMILTRFYVGESGMFGTLTDIFLRYVFLFFIFGALMEHAGAGSFLQRYLHAVTGKMTAGAAKATILGSGVLGTLIGTSSGNVAVTGSLTIPMMKKEGYTPQKAAAIETVSGLGGELSPPVMGSAAFVLVAYTATSYRELAMISIFPAVLYYLPIYLMVHFEGLRDKRRAHVQASGETGWQLLRAYSHLACAPLVLIALIAAGYSPTYAAAGGVITAAVLSQIQKTDRLTLRDLWGVLVEGTMNFLSLGATAPVLGIILVMVLLIGLPSTMTTVAVNLASGSIIFVMLGVFLLALVLGMGMPIVAAYMILATVAAPALMTFKIPLLTAHLFIFWYTQTAALTPPVALATQIASAIAGVSMWKTAYEAMRLAIGMFVVPVVMVFGSLLSNQAGLRFWSFVATGTALALWSAAIVGFVRSRLGWPERSAMLILVAGIAWPWTPLQAASVVLGITYLAARYFAWPGGATGKG